MAVAHNGTRADEHVSELIGRTSYMQGRLYSSRGAVVSLDQTIPDYAFYDRLRRGKEPGYKLGALFAKRIERVLAAWVFGEGVDVMLNKDIAAEYDEERVIYTNAQLQNFVGGLLDSGQDNETDDMDIDDAGGALLPGVFRDALGLGDQYVIVNSNGTLSIPSPDTVEMERDELDYRRLLSLTITTKLPSGWTVTDVYTATERTVTYKKGDDERVERFPNLIGRIQVVHIAHGRSGNELYGHSIHEELLKLYDQYDDVIHKQLDGAKLLGNPILAIVGLEDLGAVIDANKPAANATYYDRDGNLVTRPELNIDTNSILLIGKGGDAKFVSPPVGFTEDTKTALKTLFLLMLEYIGIPESMWGGELSSARATSDTQLVQFAKELRGWQQDNGGWVARLCKIWLQYRALTDPQIIVDKLTVEWPTAIEEDREMLLKFIEFAANKNLLKAETALQLLQLVDEPAEEVEEAQEEAAERADVELARAQAMAATQPQEDRQGPEGSRPVAQMSDGNGYNEHEASAIVAGAIRTLAGGE